MNETSSVIERVLSKIGQDSIENLIQNEIKDCTPPKPTLFQEVYDEIEGMGPIQNLLKDPGVSEILINSFDVIFFEEKGLLKRAETRFSSPITYERFVKRLLALIDKTADYRHPVADGTLERDTRVQILVPPVSKNPVVSIRKHVFSRWSLEELHHRHFANAESLGRLKKVLADRKNLLIYGPTGSGKTTLLRALIDEVPSDERVVTVEDTDELGISNERGVGVLTRTVPDDLVPPINLSQLLKHSLRLRPDRIIVGEIRGTEALVFLDAISTGHRGSMSSIHALSARQAISRLESLVSRVAPQWPLKAIRQTIYDGLEVIVGVDKIDGHRRLTEIAALSGLEDFGILLESWKPKFDA